MTLDNILTRVKQQFKSPAKRQLMLMLMATVAGSAITLLVQLAMSLFLNPAEFGEIRVIWGYFLLAAPFVLLGVIAPLGRLTISPSAQARRLLYWTESLRWWAVPALVSSLLLALLAWKGWITVNPALALPLAVLMCTLPLWGVSELYQNFWKFVRARNLASVGLIIAKLGLIGGLMGIWLRPFDSAPLSFAVGYMLGMLVVWCGLQVLHKPAISGLEKSEPGSRLDKAEWDIVWRFLPVALVANIVNVVAVQMDVVLLDRFAIDAHEVGLYMFAMMFAGAVLLVQDPVLSFLLPELGVIAERDPKTFVKRILLYQLGLSGFMLLLGAVMVVIVPLMVRWFFDPAYLDSMVYLPYVALVAVVQGSVGILYQGLFVRNQMHLSTMFTVISTCIAALIAVLMMPHIGIWGLIVGKFSGGVVFVALSVTALLRGIPTEKHV